MNELLPVENVSAVTIFTEGGLDELLAKIHAEAEAHVPDLETDKGRKAIASIAAKVSKSKTYLDGLGKEMVSVWKNQSKVVDAERKKMRDDLDDLKAKIRQPLTDYEAAEDARVNAITDAITKMAEIASIVQSSWHLLSLDEIKGFCGETREIYRVTNFAERGEYAAEVFDAAKTKIRTAMEQRENSDKERAELERLRKEADERLKAERLAAQENERKEREKQIAENAKREAEDREYQAIKAKETAEARAEQAVADAKEVTARAEQAAREKLAREQQAEREAVEKRERNTRHKGKINNEAVDAIIEASGVATDVARKIVTAIAKNKIPNVSISY